MYAHSASQTTVEAPSSTMRLIRVAGRLDRAAAASVLRLVDAQLDLTALRLRDVRIIVVDIDAVTCVEPAGLSFLRHAAHSADRRHVGFYVSGCGGRIQLLPLRIQQLLARYRTFPTAEMALAVLTDADDHPPVPLPRRHGEIAGTDGPAAFRVTSTVDDAAPSPVEDRRSAG